MLVKILKYKAFLLGSPLSSGVYLLFNVFLRKKKIKNLNYSYDTYHSSLYCAMPVSDTNITTFNLYVESPKSHNLYFVACICIGILFVSE